jgi:ABC-2 type transport system ATP-binding protein
MAKALEIVGLYKKYNNFVALDNINLTINEGDFVGLLGINGAGKTSLIASIAGINKFDGQIKVMGYDVISDTVLAKKNLGVVPQELAFDPFLTVLESLIFQSKLYGVKHNKNWLDEIIHRLYLSDKLNTNTRALSGGMKRRLMVALALIHQPPVIILDEPTTGVDVEIRKSLWDFIQELHKKGHTIILTTHYLDEVEQLCDNIVMLNKGKIIEESSKIDLINKFRDLENIFEIELAVELDMNRFNLQSIEHINNIYHYTFAIKDAFMMNDILNYLKSHDVSPIRFNIKNPSLEDIFIKIIRGK